MQRHVMMYRVPSNHSVMHPGRRRRALRVGTQALHLAQGVRLRQALHGGGHEAGHDAEVSGGDRAAAVYAEGAHRLLSAAGCHSLDGRLQLKAAQALLLVLCHAVLLMLRPA